MEVDKKILARLDELIEMGDSVLRTRHILGRGISGDDQVDDQLACQWATSVQNLLVRVFGVDSEHYKNFSIQCPHYMSFSPASRAQGVLKAAKDDYLKGQLFEVRRLVEAEVFDDFLEQAEHLLTNGYYQPAAVVAGCVLEDGLRKLCIRHKISLPQKSHLDTMNADLAKAGVYSKLDQKRVTVLADMRNKAAHGQGNELPQDDVKRMIDEVRRFMEKHFS